MNRLTSKRFNRYDFIDEFDTQLASDKLGQLEDIEEELGIDLNVFLKGVHNFVDFIRKFRVGSVWIKNRYKDNRLEKADLTNIDVGKGKVSLVQKEGYEETGYYRENIENYGKTWALTEEELK